VPAPTSALQAIFPGREDKFDRLVTSNVIGIVSATLQSIETANDAFLKMVGYSQEDFEENKISWRAITPREYDHLDDFALAKMRERGEFTTFNKEYIRKDGTRLPIRIGGAVVSDSPIRMGMLYNRPYQRSRGRAENSRAIRSAASACKRARSPTPESICDCERLGGDDRPLS
jgi:PAS domain S-box-containing protein